jgi:hypothetical protein
MAERQILPIWFLRECFSYDPHTGTIRWRKRPRAHFPRDDDWFHWNKRNAGYTAFAVDGTGYGRSEVRFEGRRYRLTAARVAFVLLHDRWPFLVDHVDGNPTNNRAENIREATDAQNSWNRHRTQRPDKLRGAFLEAGRWTASVNHNRKKIRLGCFATERDAHEAYCAFIREHRGEFANTGA